MQHPKNLLIATKNGHKTEEFRSLLGNAYNISDLSKSDYPPIEETGETFLENATLKAVGISKLTEEWVIADDSGLEVDALNGAPGVYSARYAGEGSNDLSNNNKLLQELAKLPTETPRSARFRCVLVIAQHGKVLTHFSGTIEGHITNALQGDKGFGYDPLFIPEGFEQTFGQLGAEIKNTLSHRARAMDNALPWIQEHL